MFDNLWVPWESINQSLNIYDNDILMVEQIEESLVNYCEVYYVSSKIPLWVKATEYTPHLILLINHQTQIIPLLDQEEH